MNLIEKQNRAPPPRAEPVLGGIQNRPHFLHPNSRRVDLLEMTVHRRRDHLGQRGFPRPRRPIENHRQQPVGLKHPPQQFARAQEMFLPDKFLQRPRPHPHRQGRHPRQILLA